MSEALKKIIASKRLPVLFIGSGLSKRYLDNYPSWEQLLENLRIQIGISESAYAAKKQEFKSSDYSISNGKLNQLMASYLQSSLLDKIQNDNIDLSTLFTPEENRMCIDSGVDYFKLLVAKNLSSYTIRSDKKEELELLQRISNKISMVFTTNYDCFLKNEIFKDFKEYESQNKYYFRTNNGYGEIYKIHGSISNPNGIIICEQDYKKFNESLKIVSSKLINALLDFPIIFLGYSLEDENIKKIMTDFVNSFDDEILQDIKKYMILVVYEEGQTELIEGEKQFSDEGTGKSITLTTIKTDNFAELYKSINQLTPTATAYELRKYKSMVANIISRASKGEKAIFAQEIDDAQADTVALYIGHKSEIERIDKSLDIFTNEDIIKKILLDEPLDYNSIAKVWYDAKGIRATEYTPVFLIKNKMTIPFEEGCASFKRSYKSRKIYFDREMNLKGKSLNADCLAKLLQKTMSSQVSLLSKMITICEAYMTSLKNKKITIEQYESIVKSLLTDYPNCISDSSFKKATCYLWYMKYEQ